MAFYEGNRVRLSEAGKQRRGEGYASWTGTLRCSCPPYTVLWDQSGSTSNHEEYELEDLVPPPPPDPLEGTPKRMKPFYAGVRAFTKVVEEAKT